MARFWKEPYSDDKARSLGIHDFEESLVTGPKDAKWIYYVEVCQFTFAFFSLNMIEEYRDFFSQKILPAKSAFTRGAGAGVGDGQTRFERLPLRLRKEPKRQKVLKALELALLEFGPPPGPFKRIIRPATAEERRRHARIRQQVMQEFPPAKAADE